MRTLFVQDGVMDVVKDNVSTLLRCVIKAAHPDVLQELVAGLTGDAVRDAGDARSLFTLFHSIYRNPRAPAALVRQCLATGWQLALSPTQRRFVFPMREAGSGAASDKRAADSDSAEMHLFGWTVLNAERAWRSHLHEALPMEERFTMVYIRECLRLVASCGAAASRAVNALLPRQRLDRVRALRFSCSRLYS